MNEQQNPGDKYTAESIAPLQNWLQEQEAEMIQSVTSWAEINSHSYNTDGLDRMLKTLEEAFAPLGGTAVQHTLPPHEKVNERGVMASYPLGRCLQIEKNTSAQNRVLLVIHMDTVYPPGSSQSIQIANGRIAGPGVADAKGGIAVMLWALKALEHFRPDTLGWTVFLNSDEEIGSVGSYPLLKELAAKHQVGLLFEPCLPNGHLIGQRKGSGNFHILVRGKAAHAGREFDKGRNAIVALSRCVTEINELTGRWDKATFNIGTIHGGNALNVVPDLAIAGLNVRFANPDDQEKIIQALHKIVNQVSAQAEYSCELEGQFFSPPKPLDKQYLLLLEDVMQCGKELGMTLDHEPSGGVCDGNKLSSFGLANIDTLGVQGGNIHSPQEYCLCKSLPERATLNARFLLKLADGEINPGERYGY